MRPILAVVVLAACFIAGSYATSARTARATAIAVTGEPASFTSLMGQKVFVYCSGTPVPAPTGSTAEITNAVLANYVQGKLLTSTDGWIELEMTGDHRHVSVPTRWVAYIISDNTPTTQP